MNHSKSLFRLVLISVAAFFAFLSSPSYAEDITGAQQPYSDGHNSTAPSDGSAKTHWVVTGDNTSEMTYQPYDDNAPQSRAVTVIMVIPLNPL